MLNNVEIVAYIVSYHWVPLVSETTRFRTKCRSLFSEYSSERIKIKTTENE